MFIFFGMRRQMKKKQQVEDRIHFIGEAEENVKDGEERKLLRSERVDLEEELKILEKDLPIVYGYMFLGYRVETYWWEFIKMYLRIGILGIYDLFVEQVRIKEIIAGTILVAYCCWIFRTKPYDTKKNQEKKRQKKLSSFQMMMKKVKEAKEKVVHVAGAEIFNTWDFLINLTLFFNVYVSLIVGMNNSNDDKSHLIIFGNILKGLVLLFNAIIVLILIF